MSNEALILSYGLILLAMALSQREKLGLSKEMLIGSLRAVVQLVAIGMVLSFLFDADHPALTTLLLCVMLYTASGVSAQRGKDVPGARRIACISIAISMVVTLGTLVLCGAITYRPSEVVPVGGMVAGQSMVAVGLLLRTLAGSFASRRAEVEARLALGAAPKEAAAILIRDSLHTASAPMVDAMKTVGLVQLPGMMTGLILAGVAPTEAIKYQIMVTFMLTGAVVTASYAAAYQAYQGFFGLYGSVRQGTGD